MHRPTDSTPTTTDVGEPEFTEEPTEEEEEMVEEEEIDPSEVVRIATKEKEGLELTPEEELEKAKYISQQEEKLRQEQKEETEKIALAKLSEELATPKSMEGIDVVINKMRNISAIEENRINSLDRESKELLTKEANELFQNIVRDSDVDIQDFYNDFAEILPKTNEEIAYFKKLFMLAIAYRVFKLTEKHHEIFNSVFELYLDKFGKSVDKYMTSEDYTLNAQKILYVPEFENIISTMFTTRGDKVDYKNFLVKLQAILNGYYLAKGEPSLRANAFNNMNNAFRKIWESYKYLKQRTKRINQLVNYKYFGDIKSYMSIPQDKELYISSTYNSFNAINDADQQLSIPDQKKKRQFFTEEEYLNLPK